jgi:hypothetical protein
MGAGFNSTVLALAVHDDGSGPALFAGGTFSVSGATPIAALARWNGSNWLEFGGGVGFLDASYPNVCARISFDDGVSRALFVGGRFSTAGDVVSVGVARFGVNGDPVVYCTSGTTSSGCAPQMSALGRASASGGSSLVLTALDLDAQRSGHLFYGLSGPHSAAWGPSSHFLCVKAPSQRTGTQSTGGTIGLCDGSIALDWNAYVAAHPGTLGAPFAAGQDVWSQCYFRDPAGPKTTALSNGLRFLICP